MVLRVRGRQSPVAYSGESDRTRRQSAIERFSYAIHAAGSHEVRAEQQQLGRSSEVSVHGNGVGQYAAPGSLGAAC